MSLYNKYRPRNFKAIKGNQDTITALETMLENKETCSHAFLFHGPTGCGKTTIGRILAKLLECYESDLHEIDSADFRGIDTVREIRKNSGYVPIHPGSESRVWLIDECHKMTNDAQNALLKILENPPVHVYFILCTTLPQKLIKEIKGRCQQFQVPLLSDNEMKNVLRRIVKKENEILEEEIYEQIILDAQGHPRNAIQILEKVFSVPEDRRLKIAEKTAEEISESIELCRALIRQGSSWKEIRNILEGLKGQEPENIRRSILGYCQSVLLKADNPICGLIMEECMEPFYDNGFPQLIYACYSIIKNK